MSVKEIKFADEARIKMLSGVETLAKAVACTLGPKGRNVIMERAYGTPKITKDGVSVAKEINLQDRLENIGAQMAKGAASQSGDLAGDGTTTTTVLMAKMVAEGNRGVTAGRAPIELKRGIDMAVTAVADFIEKTSKKVASSEEIKQVATISANGDSEVGEAISTAMNKLGPDSPITVEEGKGIGMELSIVEGMVIQKGYLSPLFVTNTEKSIVELEKPLVFLHDGKLSSLRPLLPFLEKASKTGRPVLFIAEDVDGDVLSALILNNLRGALKAAAIKAPGFGDKRKEMLEDIAVLTGGKVISESLGMTMEDIEINMMGTASKVIITKNEATIVGGSGDKGEIEKRCKLLRTLAEQDGTSEYEKEKLCEREGSLSGGVAVLTVGGGSEPEMKEKKDRVDDALRATKSAAKYGIVPGGGVTFLRAIFALEKLKGDNDDQDTGIEIVRKALRAPIEQILINSGMADASVIIAKILENTNQAFGYDARRGEYGDMYKIGIIDSAKVVSTAITTAGSFASNFLMSEVAIFDASDPKAPAVSGAMGGGMGGMY